MHLRLRPVGLVLALVSLMLFSGHSSQAQNLRGPSSGGGSGVFDFTPPGTLYDNDVANLTNALPSQVSSGTFASRTADDFLISSAACPSGIFDITLIRVQMVQDNTAPQAFALDLYDDNGSGTAPTPAGSIVPIFTFPETSQSDLGAFGGAHTLFEATFDTTGLTLDADTTYWISAYGTDGAINAAATNNYFAVSGGGGGAPNGVIIAPDLGFPTWTDVSGFTSGPQHFAFAIDGSCAAAVPTMSQWGTIVLASILALLGLVTIRRFAQVTNPN